MDNSGISEPLQQIGLGLGKPLFAGVESRGQGHGEALEFTEDSRSEVLANAGLETQLVYEARVLKILFPEVFSETNG